MPDADVIYADVDSRHKSVYHQLSAGLATGQELARAELSVLKNELKSYGDGPYKLIRNAAGLISAHCGGPLLTNIVDWRDLRRAVQQAAQEVSKTMVTDKRSMAVAIDACCSIINEMENGIAIDTCDLEFETTRAFMLRIYEANFEERVPLVKPQASIDLEEVHQRLSDMRPHIEKGIYHFASSHVRNGNIRAIRMPRRAPGTVTALDVNDDLLSLGVKK